MPRYDYTCDDCGSLDFEKSMSSPHPSICPNCGLRGLRRIFAATSFSILGDHLRVNRPKETPPPGTTIQPRSS